MHVLYTPSLSDDLCFLCTESTTNALAPPENFQESPDEEYGDSMHNTVVLCSADDDFTLNQVNENKKDGKTSKFHPLCNELPDWLLCGTNFSRTDFQIPIRNRMAVWVKEQMQK